MINGDVLLLVLLCHHVLTFLDMFFSAFVSPSLNITTTRSGTHPLTPVAFYKGLSWLVSSIVDILACELAHFLTEFSARTYLIFFLLVFCF